MAKEEEEKEEFERALAEFTKIPGVGLSKAKKLYEMGYKTLEDLRKASFEELASIKGIGESRATLIKNYFAELERGVKKPEEEKAKEKVEEVKAEALAEEVKKAEERMEEAEIAESEEKAKEKVEEVKAEAWAEEKKEEREIAEKEKEAKAEVVEESAEDMNRVLAEFTKIPGMGLSKAKKLYEMGYKTMEDLRKASFEELASIKGIGESRATLIKNYFAELEKEEKEKKEVEEVKAAEEEKAEEELAKLEKEIEGVSEEISKIEERIKEMPELVVKSKETKKERVPAERREKGLITGAPPRKPRVRKAEKRIRYIPVAIVSFLILISIIILWYVFVPESVISIDGNIDDWQGIAKYNEEQSIGMANIEVLEYGMFFEEKRTDFFARTQGEVFGSTSGVDLLRIFIDSDSRPDTGYQYMGFGADYKVEISGWEGQIHSASLQRFVGGNPMNYSAWENFGEVRVEKSPNIVEGYIKVKMEKPIAIFEMAHYEQGIVEKVCRAPASKNYASLAVEQRFIGKDVVNASDDVVEIKIVARGGDVWLNSIAIENATTNFEARKLARDKEIVLRAKAEGLEPGKAYAFGVKSIEADAPYLIFGNGGKAYFASLPQGIVIDGAFGDWQAVSKGTDPRGDAPKNIDLIEYASAMATDAYFYMSVDGSMLAGCEIPVLASRPQPGPPGPVVLKENLGLDVARVYIDLMNSTINTFYPAMIAHGYLIELQGRNGAVISAKAYKWENGRIAGEIENANIVYGLSNGKIEFSVSGSALTGIASDTKFYFEMTNWLGQKDASEYAYRAGKLATRVGGDGGYSATALTDFAGGGYNKVVLVNDRYTSTTKGAIRLENASVDYTPADGTGDGNPDTDQYGNLTVTTAVTWSSGDYYFRHLKIETGGSITSTPSMTVIRIFAEVIEIYGTIDFAGKGGQGGGGGAGSGNDGSPGEGEGGGGGGVVNAATTGGFGGGGGGFGAAGGNGGAGTPSANGAPGAGGSAYASPPTLKPGSGGGGGSAGQVGRGANAGNGGAGGNGGGAIQLTAWNIYIDGIITVNGTDGFNGVTPANSRRDDAPGGGGGGGSGGCILIQGCNVTIDADAQLYACGGKGGDGGNDPDDTDYAGGGGGGGGGAIWIYADLVYSQSPSATLSASGGAGGLGGNGNAGNSGSAGGSGQVNVWTATYTSPFTYSSTGYYISPVLDAGRISFWISGFWTTDTHWSGTQAQLSVRWGNTSTPDGTWTGWQSVSTVSGSGVTPTTFNLPQSAFARFLQYQISLSTTSTTDSPTVYNVFINYHKPKLLIANITFNPSCGNHKVSLYNNDSLALSYETLYLNASGSTSTYSTGPITIPAWGWYEIDLLSTSFFQPIASSGDFLFLNDSTSNISGNPPNGIIDFVNWTDINGNPPPSDGGIALANNEWNDRPVDLTGFAGTGINRTQVSGYPVDTDAQSDWQIITPELTPFPLIALLLLCIALRKLQSQKIKRVG